MWVTVRNQMMSDGPLLRPSDISSYYVYPPEVGLGILPRERLRECIKSLPKDKPIPLIPTGNNCSPSSSPRTFTSPRDPSKKKDDEKEFVFTSDAPRAVQVNFEKTDFKEGVITLAFNGVDERFKVYWSSREQKWFIRAITKDNLRFFVKHNITENSSEILINVHIEKIRDRNRHK